MRASYIRAAAMCSAALGATTAWAQGQMHIVGRTGVDVGTTIYRTGDRGSGLAVQVPDDEGRFVAGRWRASDGFLDLPFLPDTTFVSTSGVSPTLDVLSSSHDGLGTNRPGYWTEATGLIEVPLPDASPDVDRGFIRDISATGIAACTVSYPPRAGSSFGYRIPALYSPATGRIDIDVPSNFDGTTTSTISRDGTMLTGWGGTDAFELFPWRWTEATGFEFDDGFPQRTQQGDPQRQLWSTTPDGRYFAGSITYIVPIDPPPLIGGYTRTFIWEWGVGIIELPVPPEFDINLASSIMYRAQISEDAGRILAEGGDNVTWRSDTRWIYDDPFNPDALPILATEFFEQKGLDLTGWTNFRTQRMSRDGTTFGGTGLLNGDPLMWMIYIPPECPADVNDDGQLTPADFHAWIDAYTEHRIAADQNLDVYITPSDFYAWILNYNAGCP